MLLIEFGKFCFHFAQSCDILLYIKSGIDIFLHWKVLVLQRLISQMRSAIQKYNMIDAGDKIAVCVSGGKDSMALLYGLAKLKEFFPLPYEVVAVTLDMGFDDAADFSKVQELCDTLGIEYVLKPTDIGKIIFEIRKEPNPCSLCARMRRGALHDIAKELGCNKIALGHHLDDAVETFYMNLFQGGTIGSFSPKSYLSRKDLTMIRPMILAFEKDVTRAVNNESLPVVKSKCPADGVTKRQEIKELIRTLERDYDRLRIKTLGALQRGGIDGY